MPKNKYRVVKDSCGDLGSPETLYKDYSIPWTMGQKLFWQTDKPVGIGDIVVVFMKRKPGKYKPIKMRIEERVAFEHCECCSEHRERYFVPVQK
jgi:hypothetical protein